eukprot:765709-Amphidinium_carterae.2
MGRGHAFHSYTRKTTHVPRTSGRGALLGVMKHALVFVGTFRQDVRCAPEHCYTVTLLIKAIAQPRTSFGVFHSYFDAPH